MMTILRRSLLVKLLLAFWVLSLAGIVIVALVAGRVSRREFNRFVFDTQQYQSLAEELTVYYTTHGSFNGAESILLAARDQNQGGYGREYVVIDETGKILLTLTNSGAGQPMAGELANRGLPIVVNNRVVARLVTLIPFPPPPTWSSIAAQNLRRINDQLWIGAILTTLLSLLLAWLLARIIIRPLKELNSATQALAQGDLDKQVPITTRDEIGALSTSFNSMVASLKRSRDLRRQLTADIAHELRNPLSIILGHTEAMSEGVLPPTPETLAIVYDEARHLSRLVEDLRTLSLSESGDLSLQRDLVIPEELLERAATAFSARALAHGIELQVQLASDLPELEVDVERLEQVLLNLMDNSLKHTQAGGYIRLTAASAGGWVEIQVQDNGSGIAPADLPFIFDRFYRSKQAAGRRQDGSGLGLAISKALVEQHQGQIAVESELGQGTLITVRLPVASQS